LEDAIERARELAKIPADEEMKIGEYVQTDFLASLSSLIPGIAGTADALDELEFRISRNGKPIPILPMEELPGRQGQFFGK
jgi:hypothetical protein